MKQFFYWQIGEINLETTIGFLRRGDLFIFQGKKYEVKKVIENTSGYVACVDVETKKVKRFYIETEVEPYEL